MDLMKTEYEFLDLSDVKEADLSSLQCALFEEKPGRLATAVTAAWAQPSIDVSSCSSSSRGPSTVSSSVESVGGGEGEMSPQSPARGGQSAGPPPPYAPPPPAYPPQWPVAPPNVYVSQVTANVNVHGYMGQYYQPQPQYAPPPDQRPQRTHRRERRGKRVPSPPPPQPPPYYMQYPQYYPAQAQGAPLYHLPVYQPMIYGPYAYPAFYPDYPMATEGDDKPEEYPAEALMEQEAVEAYYAGAHYGPPHYQPDAPLEYVPPVYLPPPPAPLPPPPTHQFNVHAKNFVQSQPQPKPYVPQEKITERRTPPVAVSATASISVDSLPLKDLKIATRGPGSPKLIAQTADRSKVASPAEKLSPTTRTDPSKPAWVSSEVKAPEAVSQVTNAAKTFPPIASANVQVPGAAKLPPSLGTHPKSAKGPTAPFAGTKQPPKPTVTQATVPVQLAASTPKAPFGNRQKRDGPMNRSPSSEAAEGTERSAPVIEHVKREPPLPPSKAPMPISITLHAQGQPLIVTNKSPFAHSRKASTTVEAPPAPQPPPPAPTASDFPPPPTPRNRVEPPPPVTPTPQPQTAPGKSWASLFSNKTATPAPAPVAPILAPVEEPASPTATCAPSTSIQKPVAKVPPYDASPLQAVAEPKQQVTSRPAPVPIPVTSVPASLSYSEKTSANASSSSIASVKPASPVAVPSVPENKDTPPPPLPQPSPFADDPNSYRMGEFLSKYQIDNRPVSLVPRGLTNRSNYCYVNAILQALIACPPFYNMLKALPYQTRRGKSSTPVIDSMVELCYEFTPLPAAARTARGAALGVGAGPALDGGAGLRVLRALRPFAGSQDARQEDAEEFLGCLLNSLNDEMLELMKLVEPEEAKDAQVNGVITQEQPPADEDDDDDEWKVMGPRNRGAVERRWVARRTPVADVFRGRTRLRLHRSHDDLTDAVHPFFTLQLDMERANSVKDALELVANKDALEGVSDAWQQLAIEQLPVVLLLHLKCFQLDTDGHTAKILKNIDFPIDLKIDPKIMSSKNKYTSKQRMYKLFAVVYHEGVEATKGHYLTDAFHGQAGWIRYDDSTVTNLVSDVQVLKPKPPRMPYLLMYRRHDTLPAHRPTGKE